MIRKGPRANTEWMIDVIAGARSVSFGLSLMMLERHGDTGISQDTNRPEICLLIVFKHRISQGINHRPKTFV